MTILQGTQCLHTLQISLIDQIKSTGLFFPLFYAHS